METYKYLKDQIYYSDLYDRFTVEECRRLLETTKDLDLSKYKNDQKLTEEERKQLVGWIDHLHIYIYSGERYESKSKTIDKWMARDKAKDDKLQSATEPKNVRCLKCGSTMHLEHKDLQDYNGSEEVLFMFRCDAGCKRARAFYENGQEYIPKPTLCPKCCNPMDSSDVRKNKSIVTTYTCGNCKHSYSDTFDLKNNKEKPDPNYETDRHRFCLDQKRGEEYTSFKIHMDQFKNIVAEIEERKENKEVYDAIAKIKKLPIAEVQKILTETAESNTYTSLQFQQPEMGKDVVVSFTAMEGKSGRSEYDSKQQLKKAIEKALEGSNWRLMSDGISYRVGYLSGRLRCLEREDDLKNLVSLN